MSPVAAACSRGASSSGSIATCAAVVFTPATTPSPTRWSASQSSASSPSSPAGDRLIERPAGRQSPQGVLDGGLAVECGTLTTGRLVGLVTKVGAQSAAEVGQGDLVGAED